MFPRLFLLAALIATTFAAPLRSSRALDLDLPEDQSLSRRHSAFNVGPAEVATRTLNGEISPWLTARAYDDEENVAAWEARSLDDDELEWDVDARDVDFEDGEVEERSKIGNKIKGFFKKVGGFVKKVVGFRSVKDDGEWELAARDFDDELEERSKIGNKIKGFFKKVGGFVKKVVGFRSVQDDGEWELAARDVDEELEERSKIGKQDQGLLQEGWRFRQEGYWLLRTSSM